MKDFAAIAGSSGSYPNVTAKQSSGAGATDGTALHSDWLTSIFGSFQDLLQRAGLTPSGMNEAYTAETGTLPLGTTATQIRTALHMTIGGRPGDWWFGAYVPISGQRILLAQGQTILIASYPDLVAATYCGNGVNNTAGVPFYKSSDSGGVTRSTSGTYFTLPDARGVTFRGIDTGNTRDPLGSTRGGGTPNGSVELDAMQGHNHILYVDWNTSGGGVTPNVIVIKDSPVTGTGSLGGNNKAFTPSSDTGATEGDGSIGVAVKTSKETRMINLACYIGIRY